MATGVNLTTGEVIEDAFPAHLHSTAIKAEWVAATVLSDDWQWLIGGSLLREAARALITAGVPYHYWHDDGGATSVRLREKTPQEKAAKRTEPDTLAAARAAKLAQLRGQVVGERFAEYAAARASLGSSEQATAAVYAAHRTGPVVAEEARINAETNLDDLLSGPASKPTTIRERK